MILSTGYGLCKTEQNIKAGALFNNLKLEEVLVSSRVIGRWVTRPNLGLQSRPYLVEPPPPFNVGSRCCKALFCVEQGDVGDNVYGQGNRTGVAQTFWPGL